MAITEIKRANISLTTLRTSVYAFLVNNIEHITARPIFEEDFDEDDEIPVSIREEDSELLDNFLEDYEEAGSLLRVDSDEWILEHILTLGTRLTYELAYFVLADYFESMPEWTKDEFTRVGNLIIHIPDPLYDNDGYPVPAENWADFCDDHKHNQDDYRHSMSIEDLRNFYEPLIVEARRYMSVILAYGNYSSIEISDKNDYNTMRISLGDDIRHILFENKYNGERCDEWVPVDVYQY